MKKSNKPLPQVEIINYGKYAKWDRDSRDIPEFLEMTTEVTAEVDVEFGMVVEIRKAKGRYLDFRIDHPPFKNKKGKTEPPFDGTFRVKQNLYRFFLGDTIWPPVEDKKGEWTMSIFFNEELLASKSLMLV